MEYDVLIVGCGLTGSVIARELAERGERVLILERRDHIGGNMYDYTDEHGFLVQKYGPHAFHTKSRELYDYICRFEDWREYRLVCGAVWDGKYTPSPFNFKTVDTFFPPERAERIKDRLLRVYEDRETVTVVEALNAPDEDIRAYAEYLFRNDYAPYTAKQWGVSPEEIDPSVLKRVPLRLSYGEGYFDDAWQVMPVHSYTRFFERLLDHPSVEIRLNFDALSHLRAENNTLYWDGDPLTLPVIYTGALDELFGCVCGPLPYRSLRFERLWKAEESAQQAPIVAYPQESGYTRITEFKKLPPQSGEGSSIALEYPIPYEGGAEPFYPVLTEGSREQYARYLALAQSIPNLTCCGRLGDFQYYNMDEALRRALEVVNNM